MKRLVFCFDGTWNHLNRPNPTNVVLVAEAITPIAKGEVVQIVHYDAGVGTGHDDHWRGGVLGEGLIDKIIDAYTFLVFNYAPGDELFIFGFSRGAFTARAFVGFIRNVGIVQRRHANRIGEAVELYHKHKAGGDEDALELLKFRQEVSPEICVSTAEDAWRQAQDSDYRSGQAPVIRIKYLGVWDTVAALGVPDYLPFAAWVNRSEQYFDADLTSMVVSARHAMSIDERRKAFSPTPWRNFQALNEKLGYGPLAPNAPYQQKWWPGDHGSVGGGGDIRGLSDAALEWVLHGARDMGLEVDRSEGSPLYDLAPDPYASLENGKAVDPTLLGAIENLALPKTARHPGPQDIGELSDAAILRWRASADQLAERRLYRPEPLARVEAALEAGAQPPAPQVEPLPIPADQRPTPGALYRVKFRDGLRAIALAAYGDADQETLITRANPVITDPDLIYTGQVIFLPAKPATVKDPSSPTN